MPFLEAIDSDDQHISLYAFDSDAPDMAVHGSNSFRVLRLNTHALYLGEAKRQLCPPILPDPREPNRALAEAQAIAIALLLNVPWQLRRMPIADHIHIDLDPVTAAVIEAACGLP